MRRSVTSILAGFDRRPANDADVGKTRMWTRWAKLRRLDCVIAVCSLAMTLAAWTYARDSIEQRNQVRFDREADRAVNQLVERLDRHASLLRATAGFVQVDGGSDSARWTGFSQRLDLTNRYPVLNGLAVVRYLPRSEAEEFVAEQRARYPEFALRPEHDQPFHLPIIQATPAALSKSIRGYDMAFEAQRRKAMAQAFRTDTVQMTGAVSPTRGESKGVVMVAPYRSTTPAEGALPARLNSREMVGAVVTSMLFDRLMTGSLQADQRDVQLKITDSGQTLLDESIGPGQASRDHEPLRQKQTTLSIYGRDWELDIRTTLGFRADAKLATPWVVLSCGLFIDALLLALMFLHARGNAGLIAATQKLREERRALARSNELLEAFGGIVSHDLKTPLIGIRLLAEEIEANIEEQPEGWQSDSAAQLNSIRDRIDQGELLIDGVMAYSGLGNRSESIERVDVNEMVLRIGRSLGVPTNALIIQGALPVLETSTIRLQQVFENLIGNAFKYHPDPSSCRVRVEAEQEPEAETDSELDGESRLIRFRVRDNGSGIDARLQPRIFEPFVTAHGTDRSDSSGVGLAIVSKHIAHVGGTVAIEGSDEHGTTFVFDWPVCIAPVDVSLVLPDEDLSDPLPLAA